MKVTTLALVILWPVTAYLVFIAVATAVYAYKSVTNTRFREWLYLKAAVQGVETTFPWRSRMLYAVISLIALAYFHGLIIV